MQKVLILGGKGLIGRAITKELSDLNWSIIVADKRKDHQTENSIIIDVLKKRNMEKLIQTHRPDLVVNCINIATIYSHNPKKGFPKIVRFYTDLYQALRVSQVRHYIQIGTTGSGGLGLNIPFTHGESIEDIPILNKAAFAGITTSMLTLLSRSFNNGLRVSEFKPGLAVFSDIILESPYRESRLLTVDGGESGQYTYQEVALLTSFMGFTTTDYLMKKFLEILDNITEKDKAISNYDIIANLNATIVAPEDRDFQKRNEMLTDMKKRSDSDCIITTGNLGPPSIVRDLINAYVVLVSPKTNSKQEFDKLVQENVTIQNTLAYVQVHSKKLYSYLKKEINFGNYQKIVSRHNSQSEPWELVRDMFTQ